MSTIINDENAYPGYRTGGNQTPGKNATKGSSKLFGRLLQDATNQVRTENDEQLAIDFQVNDTLKVMKLWAQETEDQKIAKQLAEQLAEDEKSRKAKELTQGESAALKLAIDETRRIKAEAKEREMRLQSDSACAKAFHDSQQEELRASAKMLEDDEKIAREMAEADEKDAKFSAADEKGRPMDSADNVAEHKRDYKHDDDDEVKAGYEEEDQDVRQLPSNENIVVPSTFDEELLIRQASAKFEQLERDELYAAKEQYNIDKEMRKSEKVQASKDYQLSRRMAVKTEREAHRQEKFKEMQADFHKCQKGHEAVGKLWQNCEAEVDDVCEAVCITLLLPNIIDLKVKAVNKGRKVSIDATRLVREGDKFATEENTKYVAEFKIQGKNVNITDTALSHDYSSETGLLFLYIEGVSLQNNTAEDNNDHSSAPSGSSSAGSSSGKFSAVADNLKQGFMRIFGAGN